MTRVAPAPLLLAAACLLLAGCAAPGLDPPPSFAFEARNDGAVRAEGTVTLLRDADRAPLASLPVALEPGATLRQAMDPPGVRFQLHAEFPRGGGAGDGVTYTSNILDLSTCAGRTVAGFTVSPTSRSVRVAGEATRCER